MKAKYLSLAALALMGALASCQSDDDFTVARPDNAVSVNFSVGSLQATTRSNAAATDDTQRQFNQGDQISVSTNDQEAVIFQCTSTENQTWTETVAGKFLLWTQPMLTFSAYYPVTTGTSMTAFTMPTDQSSVEKIALADYMTRQQVISRPEGGSDIQMQLERKMARVIVRISGFGSQYNNNQKTVSNVRIYSESSGISSGNPTGSSTEIQPYAQGTGGQGSTYTALVVPGYGDSGADFIQLSDGESNTLRVKGIPELNAGNSYTFNLKVGKDRIEVASVTVQDWTTGETLTGGQATEAPSFTEVTTFSELNTALSAGNNVKLMNDIDCTAEIEITSNVVLTIDGNGKKLSTTSEIRAFKVKSSATVAFKDLTLTGFVSGGGPAINNFGTIVLDGCTISNCHVNNSNGGGAIENKGKLYAINTTFSGNYSGEIGGAINNYMGSLYMSGCTFTDNYTTKSDAYYGGAIGINRGSEVRLINCSFSGNKYGTTTGTSDIGVYYKATNYTIAGCTGATIASNDGDITTNTTGTATLNYSDLSNISFTYTAE
ncbi:fimbrillin family protein [Prevotella sp. P6B1]|uniref:fimbrillin family protein n=1 Tax=Prevotella sp. P6B1 TaxID=1410613 RepID=UPI0009DCD0FC|nr:fimbrillin family protein [Prevotella sp. P6B1]